MTHRLFRYQVDSRDRIRSVDKHWLDFARENGAGELSRDAVVDRPLWKFVAGKETQHLYEMIFAAVRKKRLPVTVPFRCDSPEWRRYMELSVAPLPADALDIAASILREEQRAYVALLDADFSRSADFITICGWCKHVLLSDGEWAEVEIAVKRLNLFSAAALPQLTHGVCGACTTQMDADL